MSGIQTNPFCHQNGSDTSVWEAKVTEKPSLQILIHLHLCAAFPLPYPLTSSRWSLRWFPYLYIATSLNGKYYITFYILCIHTYDICNQKQNEINRLTLITKQIIRLNGFWISASRFKETQHRILVWVNPRFFFFFFQMAHGNLPKLLLRDLRRHVFETPGNVNWDGRPISCHPVSQTDFIVIPVYWVCWRPGRHKSMPLEISQFIRFSKDSLLKDCSLLVFWVYHLAHWPI